MKSKLVKIAGLTAVLAFGLVCIVKIHAQQTMSTPGAPPTTTNWIGYLVVGKSDSTDRIARGLFPTTVRQVEIGLRSDGVVLWRRPLDAK
jgi:hypothetical protein